MVPRRLRLTGPKRPSTLLKYSLSSAMCGKLHAHWRLGTLNVKTPATRTSQMKRIQNESFTGDVIDLDGVWFTNCRFVNCHLRYSGDSQSRFEKCHVAEGNVWEFKGAALNTVKLLADIGCTSLTSKPLRGPTRGITMDQQITDSIA